MNIIRYIIIFVAILVVGWLYGCIYLTYSGLSEVISYYYLKNWPTTEGLILESWVTETKHKMPSGLSYTYQNHLKYSYSVEGIQYEGKRYSNNRFRKLDTEKITTGSKVVVFYSPFDPKNEYLRSLLKF